MVSMGEGEEVHPSISPEGGLASGNRLTPSIVRSKKNMADKKKEAVVTPKAVAPVAVIDYTKYSVDQLLEAVGKAWEAKDLKLMGKLSGLHTKAVAAEEKVKKDALVNQLKTTTVTIMTRLNAVVNDMLKEGILDGAEGVWFARDFGEVEGSEKSLGCRLMKNAPRKSSGEGGGTTKSSYVSGLPSSETMLGEVGDEVYLDEETTVTIDKVEQVLPAGTTYREAYEHSTNGGWRNRVRMALGKATKRI